jgi:two-component system chemotaxis response regulator CheY
MKVLIVDDDSTTRKMLGLFLKVNGYEIAYAENGFEGIEKIVKEDPNLIISDLNMTYMDGIEFTKSVRADPVHAEIPILMVTMESDPEERERAFAAGVNGYMVKPVTSEILTHQILNILKKIFSQKGGSNA